jgi:2-polyprenyl-6-methoxyphenol hydroxylase-like FAD-dependent oxidoreductase
MSSVREFDIVIVGAGLAGSIAATMLARAGHRVAIVDPHKTYPDDFRCEKFDDGQMAFLERAGLADVVTAASTHDRSVWVSHLGHLAEKRASDQRGFDYGALVNRLRAEIPSAVEQIHAKVTGIANSPDRQKVSLSTGETLDARLAIIASGLNNALREGLGIERVDLCKCQSITFGFDMEPASGGSFPFRALTHYSEHPRFRSAYITMFPIGTRMRANFFVYRDLSDPWLRAFRDAPEAALKEVMPRLEHLTGEFRITGPVKMRPIDLYATTGYQQPGIVLVGDAFGTACPAGGSGARKAIVDVERLCNGHVSRWLATPGMGRPGKGRSRQQIAGARVLRQSHGAGRQPALLGASLGQARLEPRTLGHEHDARLGVPHPHRDLRLSAVPSRKTYGRLSNLHRRPNLEHPVVRRTHGLDHGHVVEAGKPRLHRFEEFLLALGIHRDHERLPPVLVGEHPEQIDFEWAKVRGHDGDGAEARPEHRRHFANTVIERDELVVLNDVYR